ncbi:MAG: L-glutamate gamma-semialdehyde dehydrogenase [Fimbriimonas ginsengisoli]|uniref:L-glutamate gamma-semialdehyde dehydrogenase n=1 Tax=Fimbriimonas ginsengisoli TaxID=1005039 RepID=A0A931PUW7_FIMGI|nr:L-glutamate gamma-semialdehyde dehydrogenase [Fimbriimonas ginsengisoli]
MQIGTSTYPAPINEPVLSYAPGSHERTKLKATLKDLKASQIDVPMTIGGKEVQTGKTAAMRPPHEIAHILGHYHQGGEEHVRMAIDAALAAKAGWESMSWESRAAIFLKAADLFAGKYRWLINGTTMLGQSKNVFQAEVDAACELIDFLRWNVYFLDQIYRQQPIAAPGMHNRMEYRALEGFVLAVTPFNFTAIGGNLPTSAAMAGNVVVWKCAQTQVYSAQMTMRVLQEAGLPDGVINLVFVDGATVGKVCLSRPELAGVHFTGSTGVFQGMWKAIGENIARYRTYPRIVGETGGKDFVLAHPSADPEALVAALLRGAYEFQGQKCSAASRCYIPSNLLKRVRQGLADGVRSFKVGSVENFENFVNAVIDERSFDSLTGYLTRAKNDADASILVGGGGDKRVGYFIEPTVIETSNPCYVTMCEELFGPVLTMHGYDEKRFDEALDLVDSTSPYALTGSIFARDRGAVELATRRLRHSAGNFYINDKPTGAVVGQQPFGGARASGTNDKAGSMLNLYRWLSARTIKETFSPTTDYRYPFMQAE